MATLLGTKQKDTFQTLLKLVTTGLTSSYKNVESGDGTASALDISTNGVRVKKLEFSQTPATATAGSVNVIVNETGEAKQATIYNFGRSQKDPFVGYWQFTDSTAPYSVTDNSSALILNDASSIESVPPSDITTGVAYDDTTSTYCLGVGAGDAFRLVVELNITPDSGWSASDWVEIGLETDGGSTINRYEKTLFMPKGASVAHGICETFDFIVDADVEANGARIRINPKGSNITINSCITTLFRTVKA
jgi:hypothetical protein